MEIGICTVGAFAENCYVVWGESRHAWIIDPGDEAERIIGFLSKNQLTPACVVLTHGHFDHVGALDALLAQFPELPVVMSAADAQWTFTTEENTYPPLYRLQQRPAKLQATAQDGQSLTFGGLSARVISTPGHTPGGLCLYFEEPARKVLFCGDTLFQGSVGRTDLPGGNWSVLMDSLTSLKPLPPETEVYSGHGEATTIGDELATNPYLRGEF